jgi:hypothetical protein
MSKPLSAEARQTLKWHGITPKQWAKIQGQPDGQWYGDACGCNDDRCIGYHHGELDACGCLPALLEWHFRELA